MLRAKRFSFRWHPYAIDPGVDYSGEPTTLVVFTLGEVEGGTLLTVVESGFDKDPGIVPSQGVRNELQGVLDPDGEHQATSPCLMAERGCGSGWREMRGEAHSFKLADSHPPSLARLAGGEPVCETATS